ncbi:MAG TPA: ABC transporter substrate-binding protein [Blastococcus sp.]|nr:ABC transporter substrate-binding protein [Blastococcus sp.]
MTRTRRTRLSLALSTLLFLAACGGGATASDQPEGPAPLAVDQELRALLPDDVRAAGSLTIATEPSYPPASSFAADGRTIVGFEPDLAAALGELLGVRVEFRAEAFDTVLDGLAARHYDAVMSAMTDTPERRANADFVNYFRAGSAIVIQRGNPRGIHDLGGLCGETVAVEAGTVHVDLLARSQADCGDSPIAVIESASNDDALLELRTGRAAAVLTDYPPAVVATTDERTQAYFQLASDVQYEPGLYGIAVSRHRTELRDALTAALASLVETGHYQHVLDDWDVASGGVAVVTVNGGAA